MSREILKRRKIQCETTSRQLRQQIHDAHVRNELQETINALEHQRTKIGDEISQIDLELIETAEAKSPGGAAGYKHCFVKMAKRLLPAEIYREIAWAAHEFENGGGVINESKLNQHCQDIQRAIRNLAKDQTRRIA